MTDQNKYWYEAYVTGVYDGDTITAVVDLGFRVEMEMEIRLFGIDTPELRGAEKEAGKISRDWVREKILDTTILIHTQKNKKGKHKRYLATVYASSIYPDILFEGTSLNSQLVHNGLAVYRE